jgi:hypothetical protein
MTPIEILQNELDFVRKESIAYREAVTALSKDIEEKNLLLAKYQNATKELFLFIEDSGKPVDGFRFLECALALKSVYIKHI